jgi:serine/threonine protein kinase
MNSNEEIKLGTFKMQLSKKLGKGAFGEIFLGTNTKTGEEVAVKRVLL